MKKLTLLVIMLTVLASATSLSAQCCNKINAAETEQEKVDKGCDKGKVTKCETKAIKLCTHCGEVKGSEECCKMEGKKTCKKCGLIKGSPGCCKIPKGMTNAEICSDCGEIVGTDDCCKPEGKKVCKKCGKFKKSPGCCLETN